MIYFYKYLTFLLLKFYILANNYQIILNIFQIAIIMMIIFKP